MSPSSSAIRSSMIEAHHVDSGVSAFVARACHWSFWALDLQ